MGQPIANAFRHVLTAAGKRKKKSRCNGYFRTIRGGGMSGASHASDPASLLDALGGESLPEKERRLSEKIVELQKLREQLFSQHSDYLDKVGMPTQCL